MHTVHKYLDILQNIFMMCTCNYGVCCDLRYYMTVHVDVELFISGAAKYQRNNYVRTISSQGVSFQDHFPSIHVLALDKSLHVPVPVWC